jgi:CubicO group peptidase (beta-lactamase class C family)
VFATALACGGRSDGEAMPREDDPRMRCIQAHPVPDEFLVVMRSLCTELHALHAVGASVAIARDDEIVFEAAVGRRCANDDGMLEAATPMRVGSISKVATAATVLELAGPDADLGADQRSVLSEFDAPLSLDGLLTHTAGLRDPPPLHLLAGGDGWVEVVATHRVAPGSHHYANANYTVLGAWIERTAKTSFDQAFAERPGLAPIRARVSFRPPATAACGHDTFLGWRTTPVAEEPRLPEWTTPAGGAFASAVDLARLPHALDQARVSSRIVADPVPTDEPETRYGRGVRILATSNGPQYGHAGNTGRFAADLQWNDEGFAVAVLSNTPLHFRATVAAAWQAVHGLPF